MHALYHGASCEDAEINRFLKDDQHLRNSPITCKIPYGLYNLPMQEEVIQKLQNLNLDFYNKFAKSFARSRASSEPGLETIIKRIQPGAQVLDLGCGHGRIAQLLPPGVAYTGMDYSAEMLAEAASRTSTKKIQTTFIIGDLTGNTWPEMLTPASFQWVFMRAVLHHIPSYSMRRRIVIKAADYLAPDGTLILANWQFLNIKRLQKRLIPWSQLDLSDSDIEPGDYLLDWKRDGYGIRYVHLIDEDETRQLARDAGLKVSELYYADGRTNNLTLYACLVPKQDE
jgi:tRNA (uracil-5-)-methyltransferase TRM9